MIDAFKLFYDDGRYALLELRLNMRVHHFRLPTDALTIIFYEYIRYGPLCDILIYSQRGQLADSNV
jgi:hypothetical protein